KQIPVRIEEISVQKMPEGRDPAANELHLVEETPGSDIWTTILVILVIGAAIGLGVVIGWRGALQGSVQSPPTKTDAHSLPTTPDSSDANPPKLSANPNATADPAPTTTNSKLTVKRSAPYPSLPSIPAPTTGGLTVTENGKVIYRLRAKPIPGSAKSSRSVAEPNATQLIHRVDPEYPAEAKNKHIQGAVVLNVQVLGNGSVGNIEIAAGDPVLADAAVRAVKQWRYQPN